jgi:hypothetical protein
MAQYWCKAFPHATQRCGGSGSAAEQISQMSSEPTCEIEGNLHFGGSLLLFTFDISPRKQTTKQQ